MQYRKLELIDDDPTLFDVPPEWLFPDLQRRKAREAEDEFGLRSLASDVDIQLKKAWPRRRR